MSIPRGDTVTIQQQRIALNLGKIWAFRGRSGHQLRWQLQTSCIVLDPTPDGSIWANHGGSQELQKSEKYEKSNIIEMRQVCRK